MKILLVEDEPVSMFVAYKMIKAVFDECDITQAINGKQAIDYYELYTYDLIVTDIMMPVMDGLQLIEHIRSKSDLPIIVVSAFTDNLNPRHNNITILGKPLSVQKLINFKNTIYQASMMCLQDQGDQQR